MTRRFLLVSMALCAFLYSCTIYPSMKDSCVRVLAIGVGYTDLPTDILSPATLNDAACFAAAYKKILTDHEINNEVILMLEDGKTNTDPNSPLCATKENILKQISQIKARMTDNDLFVFYYSGHGYGKNQPKNPMGTLATVDKVYNEYTGQFDHFGLTPEGLTPQQFDLALTGMKGRKLVILDACYSGTWAANDVNNPVSTSPDFGAGDSEVIYDGESTATHQHGGTGDTMNLGENLFFGFSNIPKASVLAACWYDTSSFTAFRQHSQFTLALLDSLGWNFCLNHDESSSDKSYYPAENMRLTSVGCKVGRAGMNANVLPNGWEFAGALPDENTTKGLITMGDLYKQVYMTSSDMQLYRLYGEEFVKMYPEIGKRYLYSQIPVRSFGPMNVVLAW